MYKHLLVVFVILSAIIGCTENPVNDDKAGENLDSSKVVELYVSEKADKKMYLDIVFEDYFWDSDDLPDTVSAVGIFNNWSWEKKAVGARKGNEYKIKALVDTGICFFSLKGKGDDDEFWGDTSKLSKSMYWLDSFLVCRVTEDGEVETVSKKDFKAFLKKTTDKIPPRLESSKSVKYIFDTLAISFVKGKKALITSRILVIASNKPKKDSVFLYDTLATRYIVVTKIKYDTKVIERDTFFIPSDTLFLEDQDQEVGGDNPVEKIIITVYDTVIIRDTVIKGDALRVVSYKDDGIGVYELAFEWNPEISGTKPFVKGVPDWDRSYSLGITYGDTARGIKVTLIEGKTYTCGYGGNEKGAWALIPCDDHLASKPDGSDYCQLEFVPWKGRLYTVEEFEFLKSSTVYYDTLYVDTSSVNSTKVIIVHTAGQTDTVYIDTSMTGVKYVYIDTSKFVVMYKDSTKGDVIYIDTSVSPKVKIVFIFGDSTSIDTTEIMVDTSWKKISVIKRDTGLIETIRSIVDDLLMDLLMEKRIDTVEVLIRKIINYQIVDGDTSHSTLHDTLLKTLSTFKDTLDNILKELAVVDKGNGVRDIRFGVHELAFSDTVSPDGLVMVGDPYTGGVSSANASLNWTTGIQSEAAKEGKYFVFVLTLKEGDELPKFNFRHMNGTWTSRNAAIIQLSPKWRDDDTGFGMKFVNKELIPFN